MGLIKCGTVTIGYALATVALGDVALLNRIGAKKRTEVVVRWERRRVRRRFCAWFLWR